MHNLSRLARPLLLVSLFMATACGVATAPDDGSNVNQLTDKGFACVEYSPEQIDAKLQGMQGNFLRPNTWTQPTIARARNALAGLPPDYLKYMYRLHDANGFHISRQPLEDSTIGVTTFTNAALDIKITTLAFAADFALQHEVGHVMDVAISNTRDRSFKNRYSQLFRQESNNSKLRSYARSQPGEFFAEAFSNYYCGPEANAFLKNELPKTYAFLRENVSKPVFETDATVDPASLSKDLFLALAETSDKSDPTPLLVSLDEGLAKAAVCKGDLKTCVAASREDIKFSVDKTVSGRKVFKSGTGLTLSQGQVFTVLGFDSQGVLKAAQQYMASDKSTS